MIPSEKKPPYSFEVLDSVLGRGDAQILAKTLSCSPQQVRNWCRPPASDENMNGTGKYNFLDRARVVIEQVKHDDGGPDRAFPIGHYVANQLGGLFVPPMPGGDCPNEDFFCYLSRVMKETGEAIEEARKSWCEMTPGKITPREAVSISRECQEAMAALVWLQIWAEKQANQL